MEHMLYYFLGCFIRFVMLLVVLSAAVVMCGVFSRTVDDSKIRQRRERDFKKRVGDFWTRLEDEWCVKTLSDLRDDIDDWQATISMTGPEFRDYLKLSGEVRRRINTAKGLLK